MKCPYIFKGPVCGVNPSPPTEACSHEISDCLAIGNTDGFGGIAPQPSAHHCEMCGESPARNDWELSEGEWLCVDCASLEDPEAVPQEWRFDDE